jgi:hypothetical protein
MVGDFNGDLRWVSRLYSFVATFTAGIHWEKMQFYFGRIALP